MKIKINHIEKIEGHAGFVANIVKNKVKKARMEVKEGARQIEGILIGRHFSEAPIITARICGVCPIVHNLASIKAIEAAFGIKVSRKTIILRRLMMCAEIINSHALHLFFLSLSDFLDITNDLDLIKKYPKQSKEAIEIRDFAIKLGEIVGGRSIHPINSVVGGFNKEADIKKLKDLQKKYQSTIEAALDLAKLFKSVKYPSFKRKTDFITLANNSYYANYDGKIRCDSCSGDNRGISLKKFNNTITEIQRQYDVVKLTKIKGNSFMVGALARVNNNCAKLNPEAKKMFISLKWRIPQYNTFYNVMAQAIEIVHFIEEANKLINVLINMNNKLNANAANMRNSKVKFKLRAGQGLGAVEAPRGALFHYYKISKAGIIDETNIITPTAQFLANLEDDLKVYLPGVKDLNRKNRELHIKRMIRAYDPCISCATH